ncbi:MAG: mannose-6-phosphate isomerase, partial [Clostridia bacterium]|nr:mannose-6-phosphate isomerase [Clostridia bacterium]
MSVKKLNPYCRPAIWGGCAFKEVFESSLENVAEAWVWSVREGEDSTLADGAPLRMHLKEQGFLENLANPLLIKLLDAKDILSVQVHPNDEAAFALEGLSCGKTEM